MDSRPRAYRVLDQEAADVRDTPYGAVGTLFSGEGIEAVWVAKRDEDIDSEWFSQQTTDLLLVVQGQLRIDFADPAVESMTLNPGDLLVLPPETRCRGYRWPREAEEATIFLAFYRLSTAVPPLASQV